MNTPKDNASKKSNHPAFPAMKEPPKITGIILSWMCGCGWVNDNNPGPCRKCGKP